MKQFTGTRLKTRLYLLVLAAFIPVSVLIFYIAEGEKAEETEAILQKTIVLTKAVAIEENQKLESTLSLLEVLSDAFLMLEGHMDRLSALMANLLRQSNDGYTQFGIIDLDGRLLAGSNPSAISQDYSDKSWFSACLQSKELTMGEYQGDHIDGEPMLYFVLPILDTHRQIVAVVFTAAKLAWMNPGIFKQLIEFPKGSRLTLLDDSKGMLRYEVDTGQWSILTSFDPELHQQIITRQSGTLSASDENGVTRIYAFTPLTSPFRDRRVSVVLGVPEALALSASTRNFTRNVVLLIVLALMSMLFIWWASDFYILRRLRKMVSVTRELSNGNLGARIGKIGARDELGHLAGVFDEMATSLQLRIEREEEVIASLEKSREQIRNLVAHQLKVRDQERIRIAREIHDQFGQSLTILKMDLFLLKKRLPDNILDVEEKLEVMSRVIDESLENLHTITSELRSVILDDFGLAAAIEWQAEEFRNRSGIDCRIEKIGSEPEMSKDQAIAVFRIFQEILTNIMRHAQASEVVVLLEADDSGLILQVQDNGRGITEAEINDPKSYGLLGIRERLYPWNGSVSFEGRPWQGTCVTVRLPLSTEGDPQ